MAKQAKQTIAATTNTLLTDVPERSLIRIYSSAAAFIGHGVASTANGFPVDSTSTLIMRCTSEGIYVYSTGGCNINWIEIDLWV